MFPIGNDRAELVMEYLTGLMTFAKVVETGSFSAAARALQVSKSHVSKQVGALERSLGVRLLNRTTRRLSLTEVGSALHGHCQRIVHEADAAVALATRAQAEPLGTLRLSAPVSFTASYLAPALAEFLSRYPALHLEIDASDRAVDLADEGFDLALRLSARPAPGLVARRIAPLRWVTCAAPSYLQAHGTPTTPRDLLAHECLSYGGLPASGGWRYRVDGRIVTLPVTGRLRSNQAAVMHQMGLAGLGIIRFPTYVVDADLRAQRLVSLLDAYMVDDEVALYAVWLPTRWMQPKVRVFVDFVLDRFGRL